MTDVDRWLTCQPLVIEKAVTDACREAFDAGGWSDHEVRQAILDTWRLSRSEDCFYDRPSIGPVYASWYHPRRLQTMLRLLRPRLDELVGRPAVELIDIGSGTSATAWAMGLLWAARLECGLDVPPLHVHAIDSSPFMSRFAELAWTSHFLAAFPRCREHVHVTFRPESWLHVRIDDLKDRPDVVGSFVLDHSDASRTSETGAALFEFAGLHSARSLLMSTAAGKRAVLDSVCERATADGWAAEEPRSRDPYWVTSGSLLDEARSELYGGRAGVERELWQRPVGWLDRSVEHRRLVAEDQSPRSLFGVAVEPLPVLNAEQDRALRSSARRLRIAGAAGSGKSLVLAARVARAISETGRSLDILVSAFNKKMIEHLRELIEQWLQGAAKGCWRSDDRKGESWRWEGTNAAGVRSALDLRNWDKQIHRLAEKPGRIHPREYEILRRGIARARERLGLSPSELGDVLNPDFLRAEWHRVAYGLGAWDWETYRRIPRTGRGDRRMTIDGRTRAAAWTAMSELDNFTTRRMSVLRRIVEGVHVPRYDRIFFDEAQDLVPADVEILEAMIRPEGEITVAGDRTQSMHVGASHAVSRLPGRGRVSWQPVALTGSYRIPLRVAECPKPLAERVLDNHPSEDGSALVPMPRKAAVAGFRPILVWADSEAEAARQVADIARCFEVRQASFVERADRLRGAASMHMEGGVATESESMRVIKGLERECIVWSLRHPIRIDEALGEFVYTALTRTRRLLVLAGGPGSDADLIEILRLLDLRRISPWTREAERMLLEWGLPGWKPPAGRPTVMRARIPLDPPEAAGSGSG